MQRWASSSDLKMNITEYKDEKVKIITQESQETQHQYGNDKQLC